MTRGHPREVAADICTQTCGLCHNRQLSICSYGKITMHPYNGILPSKEKLPTEVAIAGIHLKYAKWENRHETVFATGLLYKNLRKVDPWPWRMNQRLPGYGRIGEQEGTEKRSSLTSMSRNQVLCFQQ